MDIYHDIGFVIAGTDVVVDGGLTERRCVRVQQDSSQQSKCPNGTREILGSVMRHLGFDVPENSYDGSFSTMIRTQDDGAGYGMSISKGTLTTIATSEEFTESVPLRPSSLAASENEYGLPWEVDLSTVIEWRPDRIISATLSGSVLDASGESTIKPATKLIGTILYVEKKIIADLIVRYMATTDASLVEIDPGDEPENNYQSQIVFNSECGGVARFAVDVPACHQQSLWANRGTGPYSNLLNNSDLLTDPLGADGSGAEHEKKVSGANQRIREDLCTGEITVT